MKETREREAEAAKLAKQKAQQGAKDTREADKQLRGEAQAKKLFAPASRAQKSRQVVGKDDEKEEEPENPSGRPKRKIRLPERFSEDIVDLT